MSFKVYVSGLKWKDWIPITKQLKQVNIPFDSYVEQLNSILGYYNGECIIHGDRYDRSRKIIGFEFDTEQDYLILKLSL